MKKIQIFICMSSSKLSKLITSHFGQAKGYVIGHEMSIMYY